MSLAPHELEALLRLLCVPGAGPATLRRLLADHGSAEAVLALPWSVLGERGFERDSRRTQARVARALRTLDDLQVRVLHERDPAYPERLRHLLRPPLLLFVRGAPELLDAGGVAVVGTRRPTEYGTEVAGMLAAGLARAGLTVWSGLARGIDAAAHTAAADAGGRTGAVLGCGIDVAYPPEHERLAERIAAHGVLISEYLPGEPPLPHRFPERNRLIACLAAALVVVEAREDGGALITAEQATELGRTVMAVPGPVGRPTSSGPNRLIQDGAKLVIEVPDVLEELGFELNAAAARGRPSARRRWTRRGSTGRGGRKGATDPTAASSSPAAAGTGETDRPAHARKGAPVAARYQRLWDALEGGAREVNELAATCGQPVSLVLALLLELELDGRVTQLAGSRYRRAA